MSGNTTKHNGQTPEHLDIAIIGAGIAGLTLAIGLLKQDIKVTVYESAHHFGEIGAGVAFGTNALNAMRLISPELVEAFDHVSTSNLWPSKSELWFEVRLGQDDGEKRSGDLLCAVNCSGGQATAHRAHLLDEFTKLVPLDIVHFNKRVLGVEQARGGGIQLTFRDGSETVHSAVVGCDGIKSETRKYVLGGKDVPAAYASFSGQYCHRGLVPMDQAIKVLGEELAQNNEVYIGRNGHVTTFPVDKGKTMNVIAFGRRQTWPHETWVVPSSKEELLEHYAGWGAGVKKTLQLMENTDIWAQFDDFDHPADTYYRGCVCISGDAAHASSSHQGSGAGMAIEDAFVLSSLLAQVKEPSRVESAFKAYDAVRRVRTQRLVASSREAGSLWSMELEGIKDDLDKLRQNIMTRMQWIWEEDLEAEVEEGKRQMRL